MLTAQSNDHLLKSKYLDHLEKNKTNHFSTFHKPNINYYNNNLSHTTKTINLKSNLKTKTGIKSPTKNRVEINTEQIEIENNISKPIKSSIMVKPMSAKPVKKICFDDPNLFRSSSTNMVRYNRAMHFLANKPKQLNQDVGFFLSRIIVKETLLK